MFAIRARIPTLGTLPLAITAGLLVAGAALADHNQPREAKSFSVSFVRAYEPCEAPNDTATALGIPACTPAVPLDPVCGIDPQKGRGFANARVIPGADTRVRVFVKGLTDCDGETLTVVAGSRETTDDCASGDSCTTVDIDFALGSCVVENGRCRINTTVNEFLGFPVFAPGARTGIEVRSCGLVRTTGPGAPAQTLSCGLLVQ